MTQIEGRERFDGRGSSWLTRLTVLGERPVSNLWCVVGWLSSTAIFFGIFGLLGGAAVGDASQSIYSTWAIAHGRFACMYSATALPANLKVHVATSQAAPLYPLLSGAVAALFRLGHALPFPSVAQYGGNCATAYELIGQWSTKSGAIVPTLRLCVLTWPFILAGVVCLVRASGITRRAWELVAVLAVSLVVPLYECLTFYFHPQDVLAMGLILLSASAALKDRWLIAGIALGMAVASQQYAILPAVALVILASGYERLRLGLGFAGITALIDVPVLLATRGRALYPIVEGTNRAGYNVKSAGGTVVWEIAHRGLGALLLGRVLPILVVAVFAVLLRRHFPSPFRPVDLMSIVTSSLLVRLIFEVNLFNYYFLAVAVGLVAMDLVAATVRRGVVAWLALLVVIMSPFHAGLLINETSWNNTGFDVLPVVIFIGVAASTCRDVAMRRIHPYKFAWLLVAALVGETRLWGLASPPISPSVWLLQLIFIPTASWLALQPLLAGTSLSAPLRLSASTPESSASC